MSETVWTQDGWYGPTPEVEAAKQMIESDPRVGGVLPEVGLPATLIDFDGTEAIVGFVSSEPIPVPEGLKRVNPAMLNRMLGSTF